MNPGSIEPGRSEFEDAYDAHLTGDVADEDEVFSAELLDVAVEALKPGKPVCVAADEPVVNVVKGMAERNQGCVLVVEGERLIGIFTERDLVRRVVGKMALDTPIGEVMTREPEAVAFFNSIAFALNKMTVGGFRHVPIVDTELKPLGVISMRDVIDYFADRFPKQVLNVPPDPTIVEPDRIGGGG